MHEGLTTSETALVDEPKPVFCILTHAGVQKRPALQELPPFARFGNEIVGYNAANWEYGLYARVGVKAVAQSARGPWAICLTLVSRFFIDKRSVSVSGITLLRPFVLGETKPVHLAAQSS